MSEPLSPLWWLEKLEGEIASRSVLMSKMDMFYGGNHPLPFVTRAHDAKMRNEFRQLLEDSRTNFCGLVVDSIEERLQVDGFRLSASRDESEDEVAWGIWQANQMDSESQTAFLEALVKGWSYLSVWGDGESASIAVEDPLQTAVGYVPGSNFRERAAAVKIWRDDWTGMNRANVYLPDGIYKFEAKSAPLVGPPTQWPGETQTVNQAAGGVGSTWKEIDGSFVANPLGVVPIVPLRNQPRLRTEGRSDLADVWRIQSQINGFTFLLALAGYFGAHRQRWAVGLTLMEDDRGNPVEPFDVAVDRLFATENPDARFGDFDATDLGGYIQAIEQKVKQIANITKIPRHYLIEEGQSPSGDAIKSAESGLVKKVERKQRPFGEGIEEAMRLARRFAGAGVSPPDSEVVWADPQVRTEAEVTDAAIKRFQAKLTPWRQTMEDLGYTQTQIERMLQAFGGVEPQPDAATAAGMQPAA